jgi:hypothetical protein
MPDETTAQGPAISDTIQQVQGIFASDEALQNAVGLLTREGFDRAALSLPVAHQAASAATPEGSALDPNTEDDQRQARTLGSSTAAAAGAMLGAGVVVATGGLAAVAIAAAAGGAALAGGSVFAATSAADASNHEGREASAAVGELMLAVTVRNPAEAAKAEATFRSAGATDVRVRRRD